MISLGLSLFTCEMGTDTRPLQGLELPDQAPHASPSGRRIGLTHPHSCPFRGKRPWASACPGAALSPQIQSTRRYTLGLPGWLGSHSELLRSRPKRDSGRDPALSWERSQQITQPQPLSRALLLGDLGPRTADTCPVFSECHLPRAAQELRPVIPRPWKCLGVSDKGRRLTAGTRLLPCLLSHPFTGGTSTPQRKPSSSGWS